VWAGALLLGNGRGSGFVRGERLPQHSSFLVTGTHRRDFRPKKSEAFPWVRDPKKCVCRSGHFDEQGRVLLQSARTAIGDYRSTDPRERGFQERMLELLALPAPTSRQHFVPGHLTASAFVLSPKRDALLLILHKKLRLWLQPGGHIEPDDVSLAAAARREVAEEVGLDLPESALGAVFDLDIHAIPARKDEPAHEHFDVRFCFPSPTLTFATNDEVVEARWAPLSEIDRLTTDESVLRVARKLLHPSSVTSL
jgi:8-oxo-dGTP pyrophosphatase MutT (NUDIX family)